MIILFVLFYISIQPDFAKGFLFVATIIYVVVKEVQLQYYQKDDKVVEEYLKNRRAVCYSSMEEFFEARKEHGKRKMNLRTMIELMILLVLMLLSLMEII